MSDLNDFFPVDEYTFSFGVTGSTTEITDGETILISDGNGINVSRSGNTVTVAGEAATTTNAGVVALNNSVSSTSTTEAATPNAVRNAFNLATTANNLATAVDNKDLDIDSLFSGNLGANQTATTTDYDTYDMVGVEVNVGNSSYNWMWLPTAFIVNNRVYIQEGRSGGDSNRAVDWRFDNDTTIRCISVSAGAVGITRVVGLRFA